jgi:hypothetical protein
MEKTATFEEVAVATLRRGALMSHLSASKWQCIENNQRQETVLHLSSSEGASRFKLVELKRLPSACAYARRRGWLDKDNRYTERGSEIANLPSELLRHWEESALKTLHLMNISGISKRVFHLDRGPDHLLETLKKHQLDVHITWDASIRDVNWQMEVALICGWVECSMLYGKLAWSVTKKWEQLNDWTYRSGVSVLNDPETVATYERMVRTKKLLAKRALKA